MQVKLLSVLFAIVSLKMEGDRSLLTMKISVARIYMFIMCLGADLPVSKSFSKEDVLSLHTLRRHLSCKWFISFFIVRL